MQLQQFESKLPHENKSWVNQLQQILKFMYHQQSILLVDKHTLHFFCHKFFHIHYRIIFKIYVHTKATEFE